MMIRNELFLSVDSIEFLSELRERERELKKEKEREQCNKSYYNAHKLNLIS
jgi:hypothetical protein